MFFFNLALQGLKQAVESEGLLETTHHICLHIPEPRKPRDIGIQSATGTSCLLRGASVPYRAPS